jgi:hypothetical protein
MAVPEGETPWYHWYDSGAVPLAVTLSVALCPLPMVWLCGWTLIAGAVQDAAAVKSFPVWFAPLRVTERLDGVKVYPALLGVTV